MKNNKSVSHKGFYSYYSILKSIFVNTAGAPFDGRDSNTSLKWKCHLLWNDGIVCI